MKFEDMVAWENVSCRFFFLISTFKYVARINENNARNLKECTKDYMGVLHWRKMKK